MTRRHVRAAVSVAVVVLGAAAPAAAFPGLTVLYAQHEAAAAVYDGSAAVQGLTEAFRQAPVRDDARWPAVWQIGKVSGRDLSVLDAPAMAARLRAGWEDDAVGDLVAVDELTASHWTTEQAEQLGHALRMLGSDAGRVVLYIGPALVSQIGRADLRHELGPRLEAILDALRHAGAVQLEMYTGGAVPLTREQFATYVTRWYARFPPGDLGRLHLLFGPDQGAGQAELWSRARSTPAGRTLLANGVSAYGLNTPAEGLDWLQGYRTFLADPEAPPPGGDVAVPVGGGLALADTGQRAVTVRLTRAARAVVSVLPAGTGRRRVIGKLQGPVTSRRIALPTDLRPGAYRVMAVALGSGLKDVVEIALRLRPRAAVQFVPDVRIERIGGEPSATSVPALTTRRGLLPRLVGLDAAYRDLERRAARACDDPSGVGDEAALRRRALEGAATAPADGLMARLGLLGTGARRLQRAIDTCAPTPPPPAPDPVVTVLAPAPGAPAVTALRLSQIIAGEPIPLGSPLAGRLLDDAVGAVDLAELDGPKCQVAGRTCLGLDRQLLDASLRTLVTENLLAVTLGNLLGLDLLGLVTGGGSLLGSGSLTQYVSVERLDDQTLRVVPSGPLAGLVGLPNVPDVVVGQIQVVPELPPAAAPPRPRPVAATPGASPAERRLLTAMNLVRIRRGLPALKRSTMLARPARTQSVRLARAGVLTHLGPGGTPFWARLVAAGHSARSPMGENLALMPGCDPEGPEATVQLWLASPRHRANLLSRRFRIVGAGVADEAGCARSAYTADFGG